MKFRRRVAFLTIATLVIAVGGASPALAVPRTYTVLSASDLTTAADTLRDAITQANANPGTDTIQFNITGGGNQLITLTGDLPSITDPVIIDGYTQPGAVQAGVGIPATLQITIDATAASYGLYVATDDTTVSGLAVRSTSGIVTGSPCLRSGICVIGDRNTIRGNHVGLGFAGATPLGNAGNGILVNGDSNTVGGTAAADRNVIADNGNHGMAITGDSNTVQGNLIGIDATGKVAYGNDQDGVEIDGNDNVVGGDATAGAANVISGNDRVGVELSGERNTVAGNLIGLNETGSKVLGNGTGVDVNAGTGNLLGGTTTGSANVISGNDTGVLVESRASGTQVQGNLIGTGTNGQAGFVGGSGDTGIDDVADGGTFTGNVIAGMRTFGMTLDGESNTVTGNMIGTGKSGRKALANGTGLVIGGDDNTIGGTSTGQFNVISGNTGNGVEFRFLATGNTVQGNRIGTDDRGTTALPNGGAGVVLDGGGANTVGGTTANAGNLISGNTGDGINVSTRANIIVGNLIGTESRGIGPLPNGGDGVHITDQGNVVGGPVPGAGNVIAGNGGSGVYVEDAGSSNNQIVGNYIGTNVTATIPISNAGSGVYLDEVTGNTVGTITGTGGNTIAFNRRDGVTVTGPQDVPSNNPIVGNSIFQNGSTARDLGIDLLRFDGVTADDALDPDGGGNNLQNYPELVAVAPTATELDITWNLNSLANNQFRVEFFTCDGSALGEGQTYLGSAVPIPTTDAGGDVQPQPTTTRLLGVTIPAGSRVTATATVLNAGVPGATSEFAACL